MASPHQVTQLLVEWSNGNEAALGQLMPLVYEELRRMAKRHMARQNPGHTLQTTALINEAYIRLIGESDQQWQNRVHFFGVAAKAMRHVLVDYARPRGAAKRGGGEWRTVPIDETVIISDERLGELISLDDALRVLEKLNPRQCQVVELRFFGGMSVEETAKQLKVSPDTVARDWRAAKAWLYRELRGQSSVKDK